MPETYPVQVSDTTVVLTSIEHDQVEKGSDGEGAPDSEVVVHLDLTNWHPLEVGSDWEAVSMWIYAGRCYYIPAFILRWSTETPPSETKDASVLLRSASPSR